MVNEKQQITTKQKMKSLRHTHTLLHPQADSQIHISLTPHSQLQHHLSLAVPSDDQDLDK